MTGMRSEGPRIINLDNGLTVILDPVAGSPVVSVQAWIMVGSADESPDEAGLAHIHEHMIFKGTPDRPVGRVAADVEGAGGEINAFTSLDHTVYYITIASRYFETACEVLADALANASFDPAELSRELEVIQEEILRGKDNPQIRLTDLQFSAAYRVHPYGRPIIGTAESVASCTREKILSFFDRWYAPANICVVASGDFDPDRAERVMAGTFGRWRSRPAPTAPARSPEPAPQGPTVRVDIAGVAETYLSMGFPMPGILHPDAQALDVLSIIMGSGESSRLYRSVKDRLQLAYGVWANSYSPKEPGLFLVGAATTSEKLRPCMGSMFEQIAELGATPASQEELDKAKKIVEAELIFDSETVQGMARKLGLSMSLGQGLDFEERYLERVRAVTLDDLSRAAAKYLRPDAAAVALLWPQDTDGAPSEEELASICKAAPRLAGPAASAAAVERKPAAASVRRRGVGVEETLYRIEPSGLKLLAKRRPGAPVISLRASLLGGQRHESVDRVGVQHFTASMLTKGTTSRTAEQLAEEIDRLAGSLNGFSGRNSIGLAGEFLSEDLDAGLDLFADVLLRPGFDAKEAEKKRAEILFAISSRRDQPSRVAFDLFAGTLYGEHPYSYPAIGRIDSVKAISAAELVRTWSGMLLPRAAVIGVAGDIDPEEAMEKLGRSLDLSFASGREPVPPARPPEPVDGPRSADGHTEKEQAHVVIGFPGCTLHDPDRYALEVMSSILSGQSGRLFLDLRDVQSLAYSVTSLTVEGLDPGFVGVYVGTAPDKVGRVIEQIDLHLRRLREELVRTDEIERARRYILGSFDIELQTGAAWNSHLVQNELLGLTRDEIQRMSEIVEAIIADDVLRVAQRFLDPQKRVQAVLSPRPE